MKRRLLFRADGNANIGLGHVIRSLALAQMLRNDFECVFAIQEPSDALCLLIEKVCPVVHPLPLSSEESVALVHELDAFLSGQEIVVLDGYKFTTRYQQHLKDKGCAVVCIDDIHAYPFVADAVINHAGGASRSDYLVAPYTQCCFGPQYALLRPPFLKSAGRQNERRPLAQSLFVNMGGADPRNDLCRILSIVGSKPSYNEVHVVTGPAYRFEAELEYFLKQDGRIIHYKNLNAEQMASVMAKCGVAVCPPSTVAYEYACVGGLLFLNQIADNQNEVKAYFLSEGLALDFGRDFDNVLASDLEKEQNRIIENQRRLLDGKSEERLRAVFRRVALRQVLSLRKVQSEDLMLCFEWANDPPVRAQSFNPEPIALSSHTAWFEKKLQDPDSRFYIVEADGVPVGQIRFDGGESEQIISYLLAPDARGLGLGSVVLSKGLEQLLRDAKGVHKVSGYVKTANVASCKAFERAGFHVAHETPAAYTDSVKYEIILDHNIA